MTCREKLAIEHPGCVSDMYVGGGRGCPDEYGYLSKPNYCGRVDQDCKSCWSREIPEEPKMVYAHIGPFGDLSNAVGKIGEAAVKMGHSIDLVGRPMEDTLLNGERPHILDSGNRTVFESGAVRDIQEGKGRMDLLPWAAIMEVSKHCENGAKKYGEHNVDRGIPTHSLCDSAARHLAKYLDGWDDEPHLVAATWNLLWAVQMTIKNKEVVDTPWNK